MELKQRPEKSVVDFHQKMVQGPNTRRWETSGEKRWKGKDFKKVKIQKSKFSQIIEFKGLT